MLLALFSSPKTTDTTHTGIKCIAQFVTKEMNYFVTVVDLLDIFRTRDNRYYNYILSF